MARIALISISQVFYEKSLGSYFKKQNISPFIKTFI